jgi:hypothetical protein
VAAAHTLNIADRAVEGNTGTTDAVFTVTLAVDGHRERGRPVRRQAVAFSDYQTAWSVRPGERQIVIVPAGTVAHRHLRQQPDGPGDRH